MHFLQFSLWEWATACAPRTFSRQGNCQNMFLSSQHIRDVSFIGIIITNTSFLFIRRKSFCHFFLGKITWFFVNFNSFSIQVCCCCCCGLSDVHDEDVNVNENRKINFSSEKYRKLCDDFFLLLFLWCFCYKLKMKR